MNDIVERLYPGFRAIAALVAGDVDENLIDDLVQHMAERLLQAEPGHTDSWYFQFAANRARNYLRHENLQPISFTDAGLDEYGQQYARVNS